MQDDPLAPSPAGALFGRCAAGFAPSSEPLRDVTRLSLSCGPPTGMVRVGTTTFEGVVAEHGPAVAIPFPIEADRCYRVFAVAGPDLRDIAVELVSSRGTALASDHTEGRVAMVHPDRPFCALGDDDAVLRISATSGRGQFALEVYAIGTPKRLPGASSVDGLSPQR